ncbi:hypothetical protein HQQ82_15905 [Rathayibacter sp. VKM Ac-2856]|uniref:hypothetical protein n=1 Tax=unclassified Rathayibacter TaxID=2609250 RepID=UPI0015670E0E|nr:hypothetical protein [Rathayibacter sp. VKM Ac-2858]NQX21464.1 hypothetical protein [Rathayibacter sp. VKM Ac-2856]
MVLFFAAPVSDTLLVDAPLVFAVARFFAVPVFDALFVDALVVALPVFGARVFSVVVVVVFSAAVPPVLRVVRGELMLRRYDSVPLDGLRLTAPGSTVKHPPRPPESKRPEQGHRTPPMLVE